MPERIQRQRTRGWRKPDGAVHVARPSRWGNPFIIGRYAPANWVAGATGPVLVRDRTQAVELFRLLLADPSSAARRAEIRAGLAGKDLMCWCPLDGQPCHADVLLRVAAGESP